MDLTQLSSNIKMRPPRIVILGVEKIGKTTFACGTRFVGGAPAEYGLNAPVVISVKGEEGADAIPVAKFPVAEDYDAVLSAIGALAKEAHEFRTAVLDSASAFEPLVWRKTCADGGRDGGSIEDFGYGKGYVLALDKWRRVLDGLDYLRDKRNMASIIIGHVKVRSVADPETDNYDAYVFDIHEKAANLIFRWADVILFANTKKIVKEDTDRAREVAGGQRFLFTRKTPAHPGGGRGAYGTLPAEMPLDWAEFQGAVDAVLGNNNN